MGQYQTQIKKVMEERGWDMKDLHRAVRIDQRKLESVLSGDEEQLPVQAMKEIAQLAKKSELPQLYKPSRPVVVSVWMRKGGSGKTTTAANLSWELSNRGYNVLVIDTDSQKNLTSAIAPQYLQESSIGDKTFYNAVTFCDDFAVEGYILPTEHMGLYVVAGSAKSKSIEKSFLQMEEETRVQILTKCMRGIERDSFYDFVFYDMNAQDDALNLSILAVSDYVLAPVDTEEFALETLPSLITRIKASQNSFGRPKLLGIILNKTDGRKKSDTDDMVASIDRIAPGRIFRTMLKLNAAVGHAQREHEPVGIYQPSSAAAKQVAALADEFVERIAGEEQ